MSTFIVRFVDETAESFRGKLRHVASGEESVFADEGGLKALVNRYLERDYSNPLVESDIKGVRFDFLKCMDMYHSKALADLVQRMVIHPSRTYTQESRSRKPAAHSSNK